MPMAKSPRASARRRFRAELSGPLRPYGSTHFGPGLATIPINYPDCTLERGDAAVDVVLPLVAQLIDQIGESVGLRLAEAGRLLAIRNRHGRVVDGPEWETSGVVIPLHIRARLRLAFGLPFGMVPVVLSKTALRVRTG